MTIYEVKRIYQAKTGGYFFDRKTMRFFRNTLKQFRVRKGDNGKYVISYPLPFNGTKERGFNPATGEIE